MQSTQRKLLAIIILAAIPLSMCTPVNKVPTPRTGSELIFSLTDGSTLGKPAWSPTGEELAFTTFDPDNGKGEIHILTLGTHEVRILVGLNYVVAESWSPDGRYIAYNSLREIMIIPVDGSLASRSLTSGQVAAFSPNGKQLAVFDNSDNSGSDLYVLKIIDLVTNSENIVFSTNVSNNSIFDLSWAPDNTKLAFSQKTEDSSSGGEGRDIYIFSVETASLSRVTSGGQNFFPTWSPSGQELAYLHQPTDQPYASIFISKVGTDCVVEVPDLSHISSIAWSPNGSHLAYVLSNGIYLLDLAVIFGDEFITKGPKCS